MLPIVIPVVVNLLSGVEERMNPGASSSTFNSPQALRRLKVTKREILIVATTKTVLLRIETPLGVIFPPTRWFWRDCHDKPLSVIRIL